MITKKYQPIAVKREIVQSIVNNSVKIEDGIKYIDYVSKFLALHLALLSFYTDVNFDETDMDTLIETGELDKIISEIPSSEKIFIIENVEFELRQEIEIYNSLSSVLNRQLTNLISKIPDEKSMQKIIKNLPKAFDKISPENLELIKNISKQN